MERCAFADAAGVFCIVYARQILTHKCLMYDGLFLSDCIEVRSECGAQLFMLHAFDVVGCLREVECLSFMPPLDSICA